MHGCGKSRKAEEEEEEEEEKHGIGKHCWHCFSFASVLCLSLFSFFYSFFSLALPRALNQHAGGDEKEKIKIKWK